MVKIDPLNQNRHQKMKFKYWSILSISLVENMINELSDGLKELNEEWIPHLISFSLLLSPDYIYSRSNENCWEFYEYFSLIIDLVAKLIIYRLFSMKFDHLN
jgi:hypothetical protein